MSTFAETWLRAHPGLAPFPQTVPLRFGDRPMTDDDARPRDRNLDFAGVRLPRSVRSFLSRIVDQVNGAEAVAGWLAEYRRWRGPQGVAA